jgi:hypothetical protein
MTREEGLMKEKKEIDALSSRKGVCGYVRIEEGRQ